MKVLIIGSKGFVGKYVADQLGFKHEVIKSNNNKSDSFYINLLEIDTVYDALVKVQPEAIVNCAGIVENSEKAQQNPIMLRNLLEAVVKAKLNPKSIIYLGSAAEYGEVGIQNKAISEDAPLKADSIYGLSKIEENKIANKFRKEHELKIVEARIFNPIGAGMNHRQLIPSLVNQIKEIKENNRGQIEVNRLDSLRDYISIRDVANAIELIIEGSPSYSVYNIGTGKCTSNKDLVRLIIKNSNLVNQPNIIEKSINKEPVFASMADISRLREDFKWKPSASLDETIKEIVSAT
jgi:GDP-4-dehydro-6-deoxy-D-mannose reductase